MRRLTVSSLFPRGDHLEEDEEETQLIVSFFTRHVCKELTGQERAMFPLLSREREKRL